MRLETLRRRAEFDRVRRGRKWAGKGFLLQAIPQADHADGRARFGFAVSSKALRAKGQGDAAKRPGAVKRNRARRRLKEAVRLLAPDHALPGYDYVVVGRHEALHQRFSDLLQELRLAFSKVNHPPHERDADAPVSEPRKRSARTSQRRTERLQSARSSASGLGQTHDG